MLSTEFKLDLSLVFSVPFSSFRTPLGHTVAHIPHPTQLALTIFSCFCAYALTSMPCSQYVEQFPHDMH